MIFVLVVLTVAYIAVGFLHYKHNRLTTDLIDCLFKQNELLCEQNDLLRGIIKKYGLDI